MPSNFGLLVEAELAYALNNKKVNQLSNNMRNLLRCMFGVLDEDKLVQAHQLDGSSKTDVVVEYDDRYRNMSIKSGTAKNLHSENLSTFIEFLTKCGISKRTCDTICLFHYGDGTIDGSAKEERKSYRYVYGELEERIKYANKELNRDIDFIFKAVERFVFMGSSPDYTPADCIYFGDVDNGSVASKRQFIRFVEQRGYSYYDNLHIGPFLLRPEARYVGKEITNEEKRHLIVAYMPKLREDVEYMSRRFNF